MSDSFCRVDTALTGTVCEFLATVESRLAASFLSHGYARDVCLSDSLRVLAATSKRFYSARNCRQFQHVEVHGTTLWCRSCVTGIIRTRKIIRAGAQDVIHVKRVKSFAPWVDLSGDCSLVRRFCSPKVRKSEIKGSSFRRFCSPTVCKSDNDF